jgi:hypothetical protein
MMWGVLLCSLLTVFALLQSFLVFRKTSIDTTQFMLKVRSLYRDGDADGVITFCIQKGTPAARVVLRGMLSHGSADSRMREATLLARREEYVRLQGGVRLLLTCGIFALLTGALSLCVSLFASQLPPHLVPRTLADAGSLPWLVLPPAYAIAVSMLALTGHAYFAHRTELLMVDIDRVVGDLFGLLEEIPMKMPAVNHLAHPENDDRLPASSDVEQIPAV